MRDLTCKLDNYNGKSFLRYEYTGSYEKTCDAFTNMEYFVVDVKCEKFAKIMSAVGGFTAEMTTRLFKKEQLDVYYMMLVALPQATNSFLFNFVYLDKNGKLLTYYRDDNCVDYLYFKKKFESCVVATGSVYDLDFDFLKEQISDNVTADYDLIVEGRPVTKEDVIVLDFKTNYFCLNDYEQQRVDERGLKIDHFEFKLSFGGRSFVNLSGIAVTTSGETIKTYEMKRKYFKEGVITADDYVKYERNRLNEYFGYDIDYDVKVEDYSFMISLKFAKKCSDKLSYK